MSYYDQHQPPVGVPPPQGYPKDGYPPPGYPQQGYPPPGYPPQQGYPPQGYPQQGYPPPYAQPPPQQQSNSNVGFMEGWYATLFNLSVSFSFSNSLRSERSSACMSTVRSEVLIN